MKKQTHFYTAEDILRIIDKAHATGMTTIVIPGFEGAWNIPAVAPKPAQKPVPPAPSRVQVAQGVEKIPPKKCIACNRELTANGKVGNLCVACYRQRHVIHVEDHGSCPRCGDLLQLGRVSNEPYCQRCWAAERDAEKDGRN